MSTSSHRRFGPLDILNLHADILKGAISRSRTRTPCIQAGVRPNSAEYEGAHAPVFPDSAEADVVAGNSW